MKFCHITLLVITMVLINTSIESMKPVICLFQFSFFIKNMLVKYDIFIFFNFKV